VSLITGSFIPPLRLDLMRTLDTPSYNQAHGCTDRDCLQRATCLGNRVEVVKR
jgi:hypothetical protein